MKFILQPGKLHLSDLRLLAAEDTKIEIDNSYYAAIKESASIVKQTIAQNKVVYGINTGFGALASQRIDHSQLENLQRSLILSHAAGTGELLTDETVRLILALKINSLARGYSGVRLETILMLQRFYNEKIYPCIPAKGSVGASGDLAPLAHLSAPLLGEGEVRINGNILPAKEALAHIQCKPLILAPKEGLALINGTQVSTALAIHGLQRAETLLNTVLISGALSVDAARASHTPFDERIHQVRGHQAQIDIAHSLRALLDGSEIRQSHLVCHKVQDPYSMRCQPQVVGACLAQMRHAANTLLTEANAVSDNPLIFVDDGEILSGGNFHAEPVAMAADALALGIAEMAALAERRIALLIDTHFSGLPAFLVENAGLNSGFMTPQVTAAALVSENKALAFPLSIDSLPTSANQEDHVSMATYAAKRLLTMSDNAAGIIAIELLAACQGIDFLRPLTTSTPLETAYSLVRNLVPFYDQDRYFAADIAKVKNLVIKGNVAASFPLSFFTQA